MKSRVKLQASADRDLKRTKEKRADSRKGAKTPRKNDGAYATHAVNFQDNG
jgi:hypothetical protein